MKPYREGNDGKRERRNDSVGEFYNIIFNDKECEELYYKVVKRVLEDEDRVTTLKTILMNGLRSVKYIGMEE